METQTVQTAAIDGIYRCWHCYEEEIFMADQEFSTCECGENLWVCWIDDNIPTDMPRLPLCFAYGTMEFVIAATALPSIGDEFNVMIKTRSNSGGETGYHNYIDGRLRIEPLRKAFAVITDKPDMEEYDLNGHAALWVNLHQIGTIDPTEHVHMAYTM